MTVVSPHHTTGEARRREAYHPGAAGVVFCRMGCSSVAPFLPLTVSGQCPYQGRECEANFSDCLQRNDLEALQFGTSAALTNVVLISWRRQGSKMLRMNFGKGSDAILIRMEGHFAGDFAKHALQLIANSQRPSGFIADLTAVSYVDAGGEEVLTLLKYMGVRFKAESEVGRCICNRLQLPTINKRTMSSPRRYSSGAGPVSAAAQLVCDGKNQHRNG